MEAFTTEFIQQVRSHQSPKDVFHAFVIGEIVRVTGTEFDEHDRAAELNIFAEVYLNSYEFAAKQMCFDDRKVAEVLRVNHCMMDYSIFLPAERKIAAGHSTLESAARSAFDSMRKQLCSQVEVFSVEEIKTISEFFVQWYISNLRLYNHSLSGKQRSDTEIVSVFVDEPMATLPLAKAVERIKLPKEEISDNALRLQRVSRKVTLLKKMSSGRLLDPSLASPKQPESPQDTLEKKIESLTSKLSIDMERREQQLEKLLEEARGKKK